MVFVTTEREKKCSNSQISPKTCKIYLKINQLKKYKNKWRSHDPENNFKKQKYMYLNVEWFYRFTNFRKQYL